VDRWLSLYKGPVLIQRWRNGEAVSKAELRSIDDIINVWRERLTSLSWFMKCLNEPIARRANKEDKCTGHFWEARFKSQALRSEEALLSCMAYIDLNPVRAGIANTPESSEYTSIKERITPKFSLERALKTHREHEGCGDYFLSNNPIPIKPLAAFTGDYSQEKEISIPFHFNDYLALVDYTGRAIREDKKGFIVKSLPPILERLGINEQQWLSNAQSFEALYYQRFSRHRSEKTSAC
jgi:hypothetical protein